MVLHLSPFPNGCVAVTHAVSWALILPCFWFLDRLIAVCKSTTLERTKRQEQECYLYPLQVFFGSILFFILFLVTAPLAFLGFLIWAPLQAYRRPFSYHIETPLPSEREVRHNFEEGKATFGFATANLCLLPDSLARFNNLGHTQRRATTIGKCIAQGVSRPHIRIFIDSPSSCGNLSASSSLFHNANSASYGATDNQNKPAVNDTSVSVEGEVPADANPNSRVVYVPCDDAEEQANETAPENTTVNAKQNSDQPEGPGEQSSPRVPHSQGLGDRDGVPWEVLSLFPANVDILCLEEVFDKRAAQKLKDALGPVFGHILYDVGFYACQMPPCCSSFKFFNSGLFLASRFPILEAHYYCFPNSRGEDALAAKGLLCAKVLIGQNHKQEKVVGFFNCTHLHAPEGEGEIRCEQLNMVTGWIGDFQTSHRRTDEVVVFDVLCGDFNFDNCSPDDIREQNHNIFEEYTDPCRTGPGREKPWVIGTLLEQPTLYEDNVITPENLQRTLETEELRRQYISPPVPAVGLPLVYPLPGEPWVGRRIDYIMYRQKSIAKHYKTEIEEFTFITQLAGLTDHIPVGLKLRVCECSAD